ncbi:ribosomal RNA-processing protein 8 isoform X1 [Mauremys reevesii]|uniref:ribosomal RNA-processing protein 8 isoform X1 n=1 Tax=Mauremys reevesii TaxID=260615 RepID=UPI00194012F3|nr:ribosomal RNA-processing protein 8 isoform X1 [Mauremys reevesii]XP_039383137.1 ribosomal RNA-processing protein 8 isoform X1 [Mauremys reevesii]
MFDEGGWNKEDGGEALSQALLHPQRCPAQHCPPAPRGSLQKQRRRLLATLQRLEASSCMEPPQSPGPLSGDSESESDSADRARRKQPRKQRRGLKPRAASSPHIAPGTPSGSGAPQAEPAGRRRRKDCAAEAPGDKAHTPSKEPPSGKPGAATGGPGPVLSRKQWRNKQKNKRRQKNKFKAGVGQDVGQSLGMGQDVGQSLGGGQDVGQGPSALPPSELSGALRARMEERLQSARFRYINQQLYTSSSQEAAWLFQRDPAAFAIYHRGFARQVGRWPENPVHRIIQYLRGRPASLVVADFGCGDCKIATSVRNKVHSFDLVALSPCVTVCDMAKVPLADESVDVTVFCLALMGTNLREILEEANRVLRPGGMLKVAEVASRFADIRAFVSAVTQLGFQIVSKDLDNPFFYMFDFSKTGPPRAGGKLPGLVLRPCLYKKR